MWTFTIQISQIVVLENIEMLRLIPIDYLGSQIIVIIINLFKWTYGLSVNDYRVATLYILYLTVVGIIKRFNGRLILSYPVQQIFMEAHKCRNALF